MKRANLHSLQFKRTAAMLLTAVMLLSNFLSTGAAVASAFVGEVGSVSVVIDTDRIVKALQNPQREEITLENAGLPTFGSGDGADARQDALLANLHRRLDGLVLVEVQRLDEDTAALIAVELTDTETDMVLDSGVLHHIHDGDEEGDHTAYGIGRILLIGVNTSERDYVFQVSMVGDGFAVETATVDAQALLLEQIVRAKPQQPAPAPEQKPAAPESEAPVPEVPGGEAPEGEPVEPEIPGEVPEGEAETPETPAEEAPEGEAEEPTEPEAEAPAEEAPAPEGEPEEPEVPAEENPTDEHAAPEAPAEEASEDEAPADEPAQGGQPSDGVAPAVASAARRLGLLGYGAAPLRPRAISYIFAAEETADQPEVLDSGRPEAGQPSVSDRPQVSYQVRTETVKGETTLSAAMVAQLTGSAAKSARSTFAVAGSGFYLEVPASGMATLAATGVLRTQCTVVGDVEYFPVNLYDYNRNTFNTHVTNNWERRNTNLMLMGSSQDKRFPGAKDDRTSYNYGYPDAVLNKKFRTRTDAATQGIMLSQLQNGTVVFKNNANDGYSLPLFPTPGQAASLVSQGLVEAVPTPEDYAGTIQPTRPYSEFRFGWQFPFIKDGNGYYTFDSDNYHVAQDKENESYELHAGRRGAQSANTFAPFIDDSLVSYGGDGKGGDWDSPIGRYFGMSMSIDFTMPEGGKVNGEAMRFEFRGDDDLWVYIDGKLALDIGGGHTPVSGYIDFSTKKSFVEKAFLNNDKNDSVGAVTKTFSQLGLTNFEPGTKHTLQVFYMERFGQAANAFIRFNIPRLTGLGVTKQVEQVNGFFEPTEATRDYEFYVEVDGVVQKGLGYTAPNGQPATTRTSDGVFKLKAGETAVFPTIVGNNVQVFEKAVSGYTTRVATTQNGQIIGDEAGHASKVIAIADDDENYSEVVFTNTRTGSFGTLSVTKELAAGVPATDTSFDFRLEFKVDSQWKAYSGPATVAGSNVTLTGGVFALKPGETMTVPSVKAGAEYRLMETQPGGYHLDEVRRTGATTGTEILNPLGTQWLEGAVAGGKSIALTYVNTNSPQEYPSQLNAEKSATKQGVGAYQVGLSVRGLDGQKIENKKKVAIPNTNVVVTDPMSAYVELVDRGGQPITAANPLAAEDVELLKNNVPQTVDISKITFNSSTKTLIWNIGTAENGVTYELRYNVQVKVTAAGYNGTTPPTSLSPGYPIAGGSGYPANGRTYVSYKSDGNKTKEITVPRVWQQENTLTVAKVDGAGQALSGANFTINTPAGAPAPKVSYYDANNHKLTDNSAKTAVRFVFENLYDYQYTVTEDVVPAGAQGVGSFTLDYTGLEGADAAQAVLSPTTGVSKAGDVVRVVNEKVRIPVPTVTLQKILADGSGRNTEGVTFNFTLTYPGSPGGTQNLSVTVPAGSADATADLTASLQAAFPDGLPLGNYTVVETPAEGYTLAAQGLSVQIGDEAPIVSAADGTLAFTLTAAHEGLDIGVVARNNNTAGNGFTMEKHLTTNGLPTEAFEFHLLTPGPTGTFDLLAVGFTGTYNQDGVNGNLSTAPVEWFKADKNTGEPTEPRESFDTSSLPVGEYFIEEIGRADSNYRLEKFTLGGEPVTVEEGRDPELADALRLVVTGSGEMQQAVAYNTPATVTGRTVTVQKTLRNGFGLPAETFTFELRDAEGNLVESAFTVSSDQLTEANPTKALKVFENLPNGSYTLTEILESDSNFKLEQIGYNFPGEAGQPASGRSFRFTLTSAVDSNYPLGRTITFINRANEVPATGFLLRVGKFVDSLNVPDEGKVFNFLLIRPDGSDEILTITKGASETEYLDVTSTTSWAYGTYTLTELDDNAHYVFEGVDGSLGTPERSYGQATGATYTFTVDSRVTDSILTVIFKNYQRRVESVSIAKALEDGSVLLHQDDRFQVALWDTLPTPGGSPLETLTLAAGASQNLPNLGLGGTYYLQEVGVQSSAGNAANYQLVGMTKNGVALTEVTDGVYSFTVDTLPLDIEVTNKNLQIDLSLRKVVEGADLYPSEDFAFTLAVGGGSQSIELTPGADKALTDITLGRSYTLTEAASEHFELTSIQVVKAGGETVTLILSGNGATFTPDSSYAGATIVVTNQAKRSDVSLTLEKLLENPYALSTVGETFNFNLYRQVGAGARALYATAQVTSTVDGQLVNQGWTLVGTAGTTATLQNLPLGRYTLEEAPSSTSRFAPVSVVGYLGDDPLADAATDSGVGSFTFVVAPETTGSIRLAATNRALTTGEGGLGLTKAFTGFDHLAKGETFQVRLQGTDNSVDYLGTVTVDGEMNQTVVWASQNAIDVVLHSSGNLVLPLGSFTLTETVTGARFAFDSFGLENGSKGTLSGGTLTLGLGDRDALIGLVVTNAPVMGGGFELTKELVRNGLPTEDFEFALVGENGFTAYGRVTADVPYTGGKAMVQWFVDDAYGTPMELTQLPVGRYTVSETSQNRNFALDSFYVTAFGGAEASVSGDSLVFTVTTSTTTVEATAKNLPKADGGLTIVKNVELGEFTDESFDFILTGPDGNETTVTLGGENEMTRTLEHLPYGTYTLREKTSAAGFTGSGENFVFGSFDIANPPSTSENPITFTLDEAVSSLHIVATNHLRQGSISLEKTVGDMGGQASRTFSFTLHDAEGRAVANGAINYPAETSLTFGDLPFGTYTVTEADDELFVLAAEMTAQTMDGQNPALTFHAVNNLKTAQGQVTVLKHTPDARNLPSEGFTFRLTGPGRDFEGRIADSHTTTAPAPVEWRVTGSDGPWGPLPQLPYGAYTLRETSDSKNFTLTSASSSSELLGISLGEGGYRFTVNSENAAENPVFTLLNETSGTGSLELRKVFAENLNPFPETAFTFTLTGPGAFSRELVLSAETEWFAALEGLPYGSYAIEEQPDPNFVANGFTSHSQDGVAPKRLTFTLSGETPSISLVAENAAKAADGSLTLRKSFVDGKMPVEENFTFRLTGPDGSTRSLVLGSENNWSIVLDDLLTGRYTLTEEVSTQSAYTFASFLIGSGTGVVDGNKVTFTLGAKEGQSSGLVVEARNLAKVGGLSVKKLTTAGRPLAGAEFTLNLYNPGGTYGAEVARVTSDANGDVHFGDLPVGLYVLTETVVPRGYLTPTTATLVELVVGEDGSLVLRDADGTLLPEHSITITNRRANTGGGDPGDPDGPGGTTDIPDGNIPLGGTPGLEVIEDGPIPLGTLPDSGGFPVGLLALAGAALVGTGLYVKRRPDEEEAQ